MKQIIALMLLYLDCHSVGPDVLERLEELLEQYFQYLAKTVMTGVELNGRTKPTWKDLVVALDEILPLQLLEAFVKHEIELEATNDLSFQDSSPDIPPKIESSVPHDLLTSKPSYVADHLPSFPPEHSYLETKLPLHPVDEDLELRQKKIKQSMIIEQNMTKLIQKTFGNDLKIPLNFDIGFVDYTVN
ncbi:hypothetical protein BC833DRAFT_580001 [Globomyces pollinis-pini]|nr:hypothetical protein BC833DRAFT_580001 [Globomyces pollinis-pini]